MKRRSKHSCAHRSCCESRWYRGWHKPEIYIFPMQNSSLTEIILISVKDFFYLFLPEDQNRRARCACTNGGGCFRDSPQYEDKRRRNIYPSLEKLRQLKTDSTYRRSPVCRELYADRYTPVEVMRILRKSETKADFLPAALLLE